MTGSTANLRIAMSIILLLLLELVCEGGDQGGRPCRKLKLDNDPPRTINPVGTEAAPTISRNNRELICLRKQLYPRSMREVVLRQGHQAY